MRINFGYFIEGIAVLILAIFLLPTAALAHPGRTDSSGCHTCRTNCASWGLSTGEYHCHNEGSSTQNDSEASEPIQTQTNIPTLKPISSNKPKPISTPTPTSTPTLSPTKTSTPTPIQVKITPIQTPNIAGESTSNVGAGAAALAIVVGIPAAIWGAIKLTKLK